MLRNHAWMTVFGTIPQAALRLWSGVLHRAFPCRFRRSIDCRPQDPQICAAMLQPYCVPRNPSLRRPNRPQKPDTSKQKENEEGLQLPRAMTEREREACAGGSAQTPNMLLCDPQTAQCELEAKVSSGALTLGNVRDTRAGAVGLSRSARVGRSSRGDAKPVRNLNRS